MKEIKKNVSAIASRSGFTAGVFGSIHCIRWVVKAGRRKKLIVGIAKTKLTDEMPRGSIIGIVSGEETTCLELVEGIIDNGSSGLAGITPPPVN